MKFKVIFSAEGFDHTAHFATASEMDVFARMMANDGRLTKATAGDMDVTGWYVTIIKAN